MAAVYPARAMARTSAAAGEREATVEITPTRRHIDDRFPVLGFTIRTALPFYEVLLAVDPRYFNPAHAAERTASNFYASRQDSGLMRVTGTHAVYLVPPAVLSAFAGAVPRPARIYYTAAGYASESGDGAVFAHTPEQLQADAPYVSLAADFRGATLARVLGIALDKLQRVGRNGGGCVSALAAPAAEPGVVDPAEDLAEGEDGASIHMRAPAAPADAAQAMNAGSEEESEEGDFYYDDGYEGSVDDSLATAVAAAAPERTRGELAADEEEALGPGPTAQALSRAAPPAALEDEDERAAFRPDAVSSAPYGDEADAIEPADEFELPYQSLEAPAAAPAPPLTIEAKRRIIETLSGGGAEYAYVGQAGRAPGLLYGIGRFSQEDGSLGRVLTMMRDRDARGFSGTFGAAADELLRVTNTPWPSDGPPPSASPRMTPVAGAQLWEEPWTGRFRQAGSNPAFQAAQNEATANLYLDPMLDFCRAMGWTSERALAMALAVAIELGAPIAQDWLAEAAGPVRSAAIRQQALAAFGFRDLAAFQAAHGIDADGRWNGVTHAAMTAALRTLGSNSPVQTPGVAQMLDAAVRQAAGQPWAERLSRLRRTPELNDTDFEF